MRDQIEGDHFKGFCIFWYWDSVQGCSSWVGLRFVLLACPAPFDIFGDPLSHSWPFVMLRYFLMRLVPSQVSSCWGVMVESQDFSLFFFCWTVRVEGSDERFRRNQCDVRVVVLPFIRVGWS